MFIYRGRLYKAMCSIYIYRRYTYAVKPSREQLTYLPDMNGISGWYLGHPLTQYTGTLSHAVFQRVGVSFVERQLSQVGCLHMTASNSPTCALEKRLNISTKLLSWYLIVKTLKWRVRGSRFH